MLSEARQKEKGKCRMIAVISVITKWTYLPNRKRLTGPEIRVEVVKGEGSGGGKDWESGLSGCKLLYRK